MKRRGIFKERNREMRSRIRKAFRNRKKSRMREVKIRRNGE